MMGDWAIKVEGLSKKYNISHKARNQDDTLLRAFAGGLAGFFKAGRRSTSEEFWALHDVSFTVAQGDRVGIIGRNGAGKSTLLKILSRVVKPTGGRVEFNGRMASLLEVGTGFHGDLTGRENIYLNGSILGMTKKEIDAKFDEIVAFSEIEKFLDTPVKRYSSGMYVRLAFGVAAHLDPEILIVDEVLAVGDALFQRKCLGKMKEISGQGRTVLFVSHSMDSIQKLCNKGLLMQGGRLVTAGPIDSVINAYISNFTATTGQFQITKNQLGDQQLGFVKAVSIIGQDGKLLSEVPTGSPWKVKIQFQLNRACEHFVVGCGLQGMFGEALNTSWSAPQPLKEGLYDAIFENDQLYYNSGQYKLAVGLSNNNQSFFYNDTEAFVVVSEAGTTFETERVVNKSSGLLLNQLPVTLNRL